MIRTGTNPILSICIPTYNRANWLRSSLWNWIPQIEKSNGLAELIVCDNASTDNTMQVIEQAKEWGEFSHYSNPENIGALKSIIRITSDLARGEFVWVLGDDDLPNIDTVQIIVNAIQNNPDINYIYANYKHWAPSKDQQNELLDSKDLDFSSDYPSDSQGVIVNRTAELVSTDVGCFTPIYCSIMRKKDAIKAFALGAHGNSFSSVETTFPHAVYIANNLLDQRAWYIGKPCTLASLDSTWSEFAAIAFAKYFPQLYKIIERNGGSRFHLNINKQKIMSFLPNLVANHRASNASFIDKLYITYEYYLNYPISMVVEAEKNYIISIIKKKDR